ncbi:hypothetical protein [Chryseobacterium koreense]
MKIRILLSILLITLLNCKKESAKKEQWKEYSIDENIDQNKVFKELESENEIQMMIDSEPPKMKKTTRVIYDDSNEYVCNPMFWNNLDTLNINIVNHSGFSSIGFNIRVNKNKYEIYPFSVDDVITDDEKPSTFKNPIQKLILNKSEYKPNDSVYGYVEFSKIENDQFGNVIPHKGKGYFRGKIKNYK